MFDRNHGKPSSTGNGTAGNGTAGRPASAWYSGLRGKLMIAVGIVLSGTLVAAIVALTGYANVRKTIDVIVGQAVPAMTEAMGVAQQAERLVALAPALTSADTAEAREAVSARIGAAKDEFNARLAKLRAGGSAGAGLAAIEEASQGLLGSLVELDKAAAEKVELASRRRAMIPKVMAAEAEIQKFTSPWRSVMNNEEQQALATLTEPDTTEAAMREAGATLVRTLAQKKPLNTVVDEAANLRNMLMEAAESADDQKLTVIETRSSVALANLTSAVQVLPERLAAVAGQQATLLATLSGGDDSLVGIRQRELTIQAHFATLLEGNHALAAKLSTEIAALVDAQKGGIAEASKATASMLDNSRLTQIVVAGASILVSILVVWLYIGRVVIGRMMALKTGMGRIAAGDLDADIALDGRDEIAEMGAALRVFRDTAREVESARAAAEEERQRAAGERRQAMLSLADQFENGVKTVVETVSAAATQMHQTAAGMVTTADDTSRQAGSAAEAAEIASVNVDGAASAAHELSQSIGEISRQVTESATIAAKAAGEAERTDGTMRDLNEAASRIGAVLDLISDIAGQTNLLALNATIEAARAGEAGKGFAVVAQEVKQLASQTAKATDQIAGQIGAMQTATNEAVGAIRSIGLTIGRLNDISASIAAAVEQQGAATSEIARNVQQAAGGTAQASQNIGQVRTAAGQTGRSAQEVLSVAQEVSSQASHLQEQIDRFLRQVRTA
ncbi:methyl-accepting chemotaxis protein [Azospirillum picis]|uniref:Methyl-accepting chemotaxis protein n=1 Tax=Azospirillum picis TaxID=488438 RepID=A0ABU0MUL8_9PROT|nr:methyl-accepting chemotaxis protein [Azospirillum picis]MBP2303352.1 methyl-accepting chemotaxis protein [Azospirillum picis]MDQ0537193.1 methyl-accepting chemotaxis protein [Azospirillum picis]